MNGARVERRDLGIATCVLIGLTTIVGSGIFALPPILARSIGGLSFLAFVGAALVVSLIGLMAAEAAGTTDRAGGAYEYARAAFGAPVGFAVAWLAWVNTILAWSGVSLALVKLVEPLHPWLASERSQQIVATAEIALFGAVNAAGARPGAALSNALTVAKLVPLVFFVAVGLFAFDASRFEGATGSLAAAGAGGMAVAVYRCIYAAGGFENIGIIAGSVRDPRRAIPKAVLLAIAGSSTLYALVQLAATSAVPDLGAIAPAEGPGSLALPIAGAEAGARVGSPAFGRVVYEVIRAGAVVSMLGFCSGIALVSPRYLFAMAGDRFIPPALVRTNAAGTPVAAILTATACSVAFVWGASWIAMLDAAVLFSLTQHATTTCAAWRLRRIVPTEGRFVAPGGPVVPVLALAAIAALLLFAFAPPGGAASGVETISAGHFRALAIVLAAGAAVALLSRATSR